MENLLFTSYPNQTFDDNQNIIHLDLTCLDENAFDKKIDISKASPVELSELIVSDMIEDIRKDLSSIQISENNSKKK